MPSPQYSKAKGRDAENAVVAWLRDRGWPHAERRRLAGSADRGDVAGVVGVCLEVKATRSHDLAGWLGELEAEVANSGAEVGAVIAKRRGTLDVDRWYAVMPAGSLAALLKQAGY